MENAWLGAASVTGKTLHRAPGIGVPAGLLLGTLSRNASSTKAN